MKVGISISIDVTKIDKARLYQGKKGTYLDLTTFVDLDEKDKYDNNGFVTQSMTKEERDSGEKAPILGNVKVFYKDSQQSQPASSHPAGDQGAGNPPSFENEDIPF